MNVCTNLNPCPFMQPMQPFQEGTGQHRKVRFYG